MSLTRQVAHNTIIQMAGKIISTLLGVVSLALLARYLGVEKFGWYTTTLTFLQFVGILTDFGLITVTAQMLGEENGLEKPKLLRNLLGFRLTTSLFFFLIAPFIALILPYRLEIHQAIWISTVSFIGIGLNQVLTGYFQYRLKMHVQSVAEILSRVALLGCMGLALLWQTSFVVTVGLLVIPNIIFTLFLIYGAQKEISLRPGFDFHMWKIIIHKMWPIALSIIFNVIYLKGDILILSLYRSQTEVGLYGSAYRVVDILSQIAMMFMGLLLPLLASVYMSKKENFARRYQKAFDGLIVLSFPLIAGTALLSTPLIRLIAGEDFTPAGKPLSILALAVLGVYIGSFFGHVAVAMNEQKRIMWIYFVSAVLTLLGYFLFIPTYGMHGAAWMSVFSELFVALVLALVVHPVSKVKLQFSVFFKVCFATLCMTLTLLLISFLPVLLLVGIGAAVYAGVLYITGALSKETLQQVFSIK